MSASPQGDLFRDDVPMDGTGNEVENGTSEENVAVEGQEPAGVPEEEDTKLAPAEEADLDDLVRPSHPIRWHSSNRARYGLVLVLARVADLAVWLR